MESQTGKYSNTDKESHTGKYSHTDKVSQTGKYSHTEETVALREIVTLGNAVRLKERAK